jgi:hypothetical protein
MSYTLRLLSLECMQAQELDGDEVYLTVDGTRVWSAGRYKMSSVLTTDDRCSQIDFAAGRVLTHVGWADVEQEPLVFTRQAEPTVVQLWERDTLTSDDKLGETPISESDSGRGEISVLFTGDGGSYRLTYQVEAGA